MLTIAEHSAPIQETNACDSPAADPAKSGLSDTIPELASGSDSPFRVLTTPYAPRHTLYKPDKFERLKMVKIVEVRYSSLKVP